MSISLQSSSLEQNPKESSHRSDNDEIKLSTISGQRSIKKSSESKSKVPQYSYSSSITTTSTALTTSSTSTIGKNICRRSQTLSIASSSLSSTSQRIRSTTINREKLSKFFNYLVEHRVRLVLTFISLIFFSLFLVVIYRQFGWITFAAVLGIISVPFVLIFFYAKHYSQKEREQQRIQQEQINQRILHNREQQRRKTIKIESDQMDQIRLKRNSQRQNSIRSERTSMQRGFSLQKTTVTPVEDTEQSINLDEFNMANNICSIENFRLEKYPHRKSTTIEIDPIERRKPKQIGFKERVLY
ncbi:hypothetical protein SSS_00541 [Sarcoptes scabiei]|uniref:Uncharacterized protein n=1 Tax=Sarcoptes scabiei TaxID=52283 RepID=A0A834R4Q9_SARSC|nr:hypothetical protein SSS_00541 [Sarcoptes scabiei]UXI18309.1 methyltransferase-like protein 4 [Sarcoptes scabiei]